MNKEQAHIFTSTSPTVGNHRKKLLYCSDIHIDSNECERSMLREHLKEADEVYIFGDLFDVMQSKWDKRRSHTALKALLENSDSDDGYLNKVVDNAALFFEPYKEKVKFISFGNHETKILDFAGLDLLQMFIDRLNPSIKKGEYEGFIVRKASRGTSTVHGGKNAFNLPLVTYYHHGSGGSAKRSKGMLDNQIDGFLAPDADIIVKGHNHWKYLDPSNTRLKLDKNYNIYEADQHVLRLGSYKKSKRSGWGTEKGFLPSKRGGWFIEVGVKHHKMHIFKVYEAC